MKSKILVNRNLISKNKSENKNLPVISVKSSKKTSYCHTAHILDKDGNIVASILHRPDKPLSCGATIWIETVYGVSIETPKSFEDLK
jgi:hypothetical protein